MDSHVLVYEYICTQVLAGCNWLEHACEIIEYTITLSLCIHEYVVTVCSLYSELIHVYIVNSLYIHVHYIYIYIYMYIEFTVYT